MTTPATIAYVRGDATRPVSDATAIIAHCCNSTGNWGAGFVRALSLRWPQPEAEFRAWHRDRASNDHGLGQIQLVPVAERLFVANMIGQEGIVTRTRPGPPPIRYEALEQCLRKLAGTAVRMGAEVHAPRIGAGLAGGDWARIEPIISETLCAAGVPVTIYDLP